MKRAKGESEKSQQKQDTDEPSKTVHGCRCPPLRFVALALLFGLILVVFDPRGV
jgi:hypothetical protein